MPALMVPEIMFNLGLVINDPKTMLTMKDRKDIISEYDRTGSIRATARSLGLNRKTVGRYVREYLEERCKSDAEYTAYLKSEPQYKRGTVRPRKVLTAAVRALIDGFLTENEEKKRRGDRKLCMKATDIHSALLSAGYKVSYPTVTKYIQTRDRGQGTVQECYIRQVYSPGMDCEFDWGELHLTIDGRRMKLYIAVFTLSYSNVRMAFLFLRQDTAAFLESHKMCFDIFNGAPNRMVYDNMKVAVASFTGGKQPTDALLRLERAYGFTHRFCNVRSGNEKGHVERSVEYVRRIAFSSRDTFESLEEANQWLYDVCMDLSLTASSPATADIVRRGEEDRAALLPLRDSVCCFEPKTLTVDKYGTVVLGGVHYSVPDCLVGRKLSVHEYSNRIEIFLQKKKVAAHEKTPVNGWKLDMMHYISTFEKKPGSVAGSAALQYAAPEIRKIFSDHFSDNAAAFISLLKTIRDKGLTLEDFVIAHDMLEDASVNPSMPGAFDYALSLDTETPGFNRNLGVSAGEIEEYAMKSIAELTAIMN